MAQLRDSIVQGSLRVTDSIFTNSLTANDLITARALEITGSSDPHKVLIGPASGTTADAPTWRTMNYQDTHGIEYIRGTWTAASGTWTGVSTDSELYDGKQIILYMPYAGSGDATLNLTLADGTTTGAKDVYFESTTHFTTHKGVHSQLHLIYHINHNIDGTNYTGWWYIANRDTDNDYRVRQTILSDNYNRPILFSYCKNGDASNNTARVAYRNESIYVNASTGTLYATAFNGPLTGNSDTATKWASTQKVYVALGTASTTTTIQGGSTSAQTIGVNGTLKIANGGTGATSASGARTNLELDNLATTHLYYSSTQPSSGMKTGDLWLKPKT